MAGNVPKSRGMFQYVFKHFMDSFKVGKVIILEILIKFLSMFLKLFTLAVLELFFLHSNFCERTHETKTNV